MARRKFGPAACRKAIAAYRETGSLDRAAAAAGASPGWAYKLLRSRGLTSECPRWPVSLVGRAAKLYTEKRLSARDVAAVLKAENGGKGPSHVWVAARLEERGLLRGRGGANRARAEKATAEVAGDPRDYAELEAEARRLAEDDRWSVRRIADELGLARHTVKRWLGDLAAGPAASIRQVAWESRRPETYERLRKRARVIELRAAGKTYPEIQAATGASRAMIYLYLRAAGLVKEQPARRRSRRKLPGESGRVG